MVITNSAIHLNNLLQLDCLIELIAALCIWKPISLSTNIPKDAVLIAIVYFKISWKLHTSSPELQIPDT